MTDPYPSASTSAPRHTDRWFGLGFVALAGLLYSINWQWSAEPTLGDPGPLLLPNIMAVLIGLLGLSLIIKPPPTPTAEVEEVLPGQLRPWRGAGACLCLLAYVLLLPYLGYSLATALFFGGTTWLLGELKPRSALVCSLIAVAVAVGSDYLLSEGLNINLPEGDWLDAIKEWIHA